MSTEERILRIESAVATLAELSGQHNARLAALEQSHQILVGLSVRTRKSRITNQDWINQHRTLRAETNARIAALAEARRHTEEVVSRLAVKVDELVEVVRGQSGGGAS